MLKFTTIVFALTTAVVLTAINLEKQYQGRYKLNVQCACLGVSLLQVLWHHAHQSQIQKGKGGSVVVGECGVRNHTSVGQHCLGAVHLLSLVMSRLPLINTAV